MRTISLLLTIFWAFAVAHGSEVVDEQAELTTADSPVDEKDEELVDLDNDETSNMDDNLSETVPEATEASSVGAEDPESSDTTTEEEVQIPAQSGPLVDLFGPSLLSLEMTGPSTAQLQEHLTMDALRGKKVIGVYFSADWCGPCRQFTPELVSFYEKMNNRRGKKDEFEIVWVSRCRDVQSFGQYFTQMPWIALPPQEAMGARGEQMSAMYGVKSIPTLVLLDEEGSVITTDARNMIPKDKAGIGFPWRNPLTTFYMTLVPRSVRFMLKRELGSIKQKTLGQVQRVLGSLRQKVNV